MHSHPVDQVEEQQRHQAERKNCKIRIEVPKIGENHVSHVRQLRDLREYLLVREAEDDGTSEKAQQTGDQIIKFSFAGPGGTCARSVSGQGHTNPEQQPAG